MPYVGYRAASIASDLGYRRTAIGASRLSRLANYRSDPIVLVRILFFFSRAIRAPSRSSASAKFLVPSPLAALRFEGSSIFIQARVTGPQGNQDASR